MLWEVAISSTLMGGGHLLHFDGRWPPLHFDITTKVGAACNDKGEELPTTRGEELPTTRRGGPPNNKGVGAYNNKNGRSPNKKKEELSTTKG